MTVTSSSAQISYVGSATFNANTTRPVVTVPGSTQAGDGMVLVVSYGSTTVVPTAPSGWTLKGQLVAGSMYTQVYSRVATSTDANSQVAVPLSALAKVAMTLAVYRGTASGDFLAAQGLASGSTSQRTTPVVTVTTAGSWVVSYWTDKSAGTTTAWTPPASVTVRASSYGTGGGAMSFCSPTPVPPSRPAATAG